MTQVKGGLDQDESHGLKYNQNAMESIREKRRNQRTKMTAMVIALIIHAAAAAAIWYSSGSEVEKEKGKVESKELTFQRASTNEEMAKV